MARCRRCNCAATAAWARIARIRARSAASSYIRFRTWKRWSILFTRIKHDLRNFRGPEFPQGFFGIQSMMDDVAYKLGMDPVDFVLKNMTRKANDEAPYTNYTLEDCIHRGAEAFEWKKRWRAKPGSDAGPVKRGAGFAFFVFRAGVGPSSAAMDVDSNGRYRVHVGVTDVGGGAKTTMGLIAAEALGVPLSQVEVIWGDTSRCPYSVGESGSRTTIMTGYAVTQAAQDLKRQIAEKGLPKGSDLLTSTIDGRRREPVRPSADLPLRQPPPMLPALPPPPRSRLIT